MTDQRDQDLDKLLTPLQRDESGMAHVDSWIRAIAQEGAEKPTRRTPGVPRFIEWAVAASIGFAAAGAIFKLQHQSELKREVSQSFERNKSLFDVDATEMRLIANNE